MIEFSIPTDYVILFATVVFLILFLRFLNHMANKDVAKKKSTYGPVRVEDVMKISKVKEKTLFLEDKINQLLHSDNFITLREYKKLESGGQSFKVLAEGRKRAIKDCHAFIDELEAELGKKAKSGKIAVLFDAIRKTKKI